MRIRSNSPNDCCIRRYKINNVELIFMSVQKLHFSFDFHWHFSSEPFNAVQSSTNTVAGI